ncbi:MAG: sigma-54-dependent Fis family transcriptional regulator [candidate division NC10 bacterium]|nr:sigma-54-dependent Fis family transcriptional regulator [candidate division NC10 bacterium]
MAQEEILIVDDEKNIRTSLTGILEDEGYRVSEADSGEAALKAIRHGPPDLVILDIWMPGMDGLAALAEIKRQHPEVAVLMVSGHGTIETAVRATKLGAYDFIEKPLSLEKTTLAVRHALDAQRLLRENVALRQRLEQRDELVGESEVIRKLREQIAAAAPSNGRALIRGESGTGKELIARAIHRQSHRAAKPFVEVNCAAIPEDLIESELFGHEKGAFTGATMRRRGKFELADGGTLFLDEVGDMSLKTQAKVLRVLEEQTFERVGGTESLRVDVRIIAASNKDLEEEIRAGRFREDLYYRLNVIPFDVSPLRQRREDLPLLAAYFLKQFCREYGKREKTLSPDALAALQEHAWPGNVRELRNVIERLVIMVPEERIEAEAVEPALGRRAPVPEPVAGAEGAGTGVDANLPLRDARDRFERGYILQRLRENGWNITRTAEKLGIERSNLHRKLRAFDIEAPPGH